MAPQMRFESDQQTKTIQAKQYVVLKERVLKDGGEWIYLFKRPTSSEEELAKMRKSKPKTLANINDLNPVVMRGWVDLSALKGSTKVNSFRCRLEQVEKTVESSEPNLENTYIKLNITLESGLARPSDGISKVDVIPAAPAPIILGEREKVVAELE